MGGALKSKSFWAVVGALVLALALAASAGAQNDGPADTRDTPPSQQVAGGGGGGGDDQKAVAAASSEGDLFSELVVSGLPFTGFDLLAMGFAAALLMASGLVLRMLSRPGAAKH